MSVNIDPSHPGGPPALHRAPGDVALPRQPPATATPTTPVTAAPPVPGAAPAGEAAPAPAPVPASPLSPAPPPQKTQVSISPQGRQSLGEAAAALQRQTILLDALNPALGAAGPPTAASAAALPGQPGPATTGTASPAGASAEVTPASGVPRPAPALGAASLGAAGALARPAGPSTGAAPVNAPATPTATATASAARLAWPSGGVSAPLHSLLSTLVQQSTAPVQAQRVLAIQPWPAALLAQIDGNAAKEPSGGARADGPPPLHTWLVRQGVVQTPDGPRGVSVTVRVPAPWLQALEQTQAAATPTRSWQVWLLPTLPHTPAPSAPSLQAAFAGPSQALPSGTFALALESAGGGRTSALLTLEVQPLLLAPAAQAGVYGREVAQHLRQDPWLQMAALQASGQAERDEDRARHGSAALCDTSGCPYLARAACVQPFCAALQVVPQVASVQAPSAPGIGT